MQLFSDPALPPLPELIDLRRCGIDDVLEELGREAVPTVHLVHADPPWGAYSQQPAAGVNPATEWSQGGAGYACLDYSAILEHMMAAQAVTKRGGRLALWWTWPLGGELQSTAIPGPGWHYKTGGAWMKAPHHGPGFHWSGCSEPVSIYTRPGAPAWRDTRIPLRNAYASPPGPHSEKPEAWLEEMVCRWVPPGGLVLDMYAGLGSMARAVARAGEGRRYIGAEIDPARHKRAVASVLAVR